MGRIDVEEIKISLTARSKAPRYYSNPELRYRLRNPDGRFFHQSDRDSFLLRTTRGKGNHERLVIIFVLDEAAKKLTVVTQTSDHYDWSEYARLREPPYQFTGSQGTIADEETLTD